MKRDLEERELNLGAASRLSGLNPLEMMVRARLLGIPAGHAIPMGTMLRIKAGFNAALEDDEATEANAPKVREAIRADPLSRRRLARQILDKLGRQGKWGPAVVKEGGVLRGLGEHEKGTARDVVEQLRRREWVIEHANRLHGTTTYSLNPDFRQPIAQLVVHGEVEDEELRVWFAHL